MNKIVFKKIQVEGFSSFVKNTSFNLDRTGINLIFGENGEGKTTLFSALCWILYKINLKGLTNNKVASWKWVRDAEWRGTRGVLTFTCNEDTYVIARHLKFEGTTLGVKAGDKLIITKNGEMIPDEMYKGDQEAFIEKLLGMDSKVFINSIVFGQRMKRLVSADNEDKRALLDSTFDTEWVKDAKDKVFQEIATVAGKMRTITSSIDKIKDKQESLNAEIVRSEKIIEDFSDVIKKDVAAKNVEIDDYREELKELEEELVEKEAQELAEKVDTTVHEKELKDFKVLYDAQVDKIKELKDSVADYKREAKGVEKLIATKQEELENITDKCPTCSQKIKTVDIAKVKTATQTVLNNYQGVLKKLEDKITALTATINNLNAKQELADLAIKAVEDIIADIRKTEKENSKIKNEITRISTSIGYVKENIEKGLVAIENIKLRKPPVIDIAEMKSRMKKYSSESRTLEEEFLTEQVYHDRLKFWDSKGFGSGGLKAYIFNAMLENLNAAVIRYGSRLGVSVRFSIDTTKAKGGFQTICLKDGNEVEYQELSGGEQQRVDICLAFAFHDIVAHRSNINILLMDEIFENVDAKGIEVIFDLIRVKASDNKAVYCITHNQLLDTLNTKSIFVRKEENISYIE